MVRITLGFMRAAREAFKEPQTRTPHRLKAIVMPALQWTPSADGGLWCETPNDAILKVEFLKTAESGEAIWRLQYDGTTSAIGALQACLLVAEKCVREARKMIRQMKIKCEVTRLQAKAHLTIAEQKRVCALIKKLVPEAVG